MQQPACLWLIERPKFWLIERERERERERKFMNTMREERIEEVGAWRSGRGEDKEGLTLRRINGKAWKKEKEWKEGKIEEAKRE